jgi:hypothetical protein
MIPYQMSVQISAPQRDKAMNSDFSRSALKTGAAAKENCNFRDTRNNLPLLPSSARPKLGVALNWGHFGHDD